MTRKFDDISPKIRKNKERNSSNFLCITFSQYCIHNHKQKRRGDNSTSSITTATCTTTTATSSATSTTTATPSLTTSTITATSPTITTSTSAASASPSVSSTPKSPAPSQSPEHSQDRNTLSKDEDSDTVQEYFASEKPSNDRHWWLLEFFKYLNLPDCRRKKSKNQLQHASQVRTILEELDPRGTDIRVLSEDKGYVVWMEFVDPKMEVLKGGTISSYLGSYELFLTFVTAERVRGGQVPLLDEDTENFP